MIKEDTKPSTKKAGVKEEIKSDVKPSVTLDKSKGLYQLLVVMSLIFKVCKAS